MKKTGLILMLLVLTAMMALPVMAAGPGRNMQPQATPEATVTSPLPTPAPVTQPTPAPTTESQPGFEIGDEEGKVIFGGSYTLRPGERLRGDLVVFGGVATLQTDTRVDGNVVLFGGSADIAGRVQGDLVLIGGDVRLRSSAVVDGQLVRVGGALTREPGAQIHGGESSGVPVAPVVPIPPVVPVPSQPQTLVERGLYRFWSFTGELVSAMVTAVVLAALAVFVTALWHDPIERVRQTITIAPAISWVVGLLMVLVYIVAIPVFIALTILSAILVVACGLGLIGLLFLGAIWLALAVAWLVGWIAIGQIIGERLLGALGVRYATPATCAAAGTAMITVLWLGLSSLGSLGEFWWLCGLGLIGLLGWVLFAVLAPLGLGAVVLTRFGTREYIPNHVPPASGGSAPAAPVAPGVPPAPPAPTAPEPPQPAAPEPAVPVADSTPPGESPPTTSPLDKPVGEL